MEEIEQVTASMVRAMQSLSARREVGESAGAEAQELLARVSDALEFDDPDLLELAIYAVDQLSVSDVDVVEAMRQGLASASDTRRVNVMRVAAYGLEPGRAGRVMESGRSWLTGPVASEEYEFLNKQVLPKRERIGHD